MRKIKIEVVEACQGEAEAEAKATDMTKSVVFTEEGLRESEGVFRTLFTRYVANIQREAFETSRFDFWNLPALNLFAQDSSRATSSTGKGAPPVTGSA